MKLRIEQEFTNTKQAEYFASKIVEALSKGETSGTGWKIALPEYRAKIERDEYAESPNDFMEYDSFIVYKHPQFNVEKHDFAVSCIFECLQDKENHYYDEYYIFPLSAYIHSGICLSMDIDPDEVASDYFDTSTSGFVVVSKSLVKDNHKEATETELREEAIKIGGDLVETWNTYLEEDVWNVMILDEDGKVVEEIHSVYTRKSAEKEAEILLKHFQNK